MSSQRLGRLSTALLTTMALLAIAPAASAAPKPEPAPPGVLKGPGFAKKDKLGSHDRDLLVKAVRDGKKKVTAMVAVAPGQFDAARKAVEAAGGKVASAQPKVGYLRASLPVDAVDAVAGKGSVLAVDLDEEIRLADPVPAAEGRHKGGTAKAPGAKTPAANPYLPTHETGAVDFVADHRTWDGRGVTIGILDSGVDLDHPALATTTTGERKIVDWVTATDPLTEGDNTWLEMTTTVTATTEFEFEWRTYTAPAAGEYRVATFYEYATAGPNDVNGDVNRDGDDWDSFIVLFRPSDKGIWVDTDDDRDFTDEQLLRPFREEHEAGRFGTDDPATPLNESMPFTVEYRLGVDLAPAGREGTADFVSIGLPESAHGTHVAGIAAGRGLFGGKMNGAAPGAKIVSSRACTWSGGCTAVALTEGMIDLVMNRGVDVVNMSIGGLPGLNDGANARAYLYNTLINDFGVQLFLSAGNSGPGLNTIGDPSVASDVVAVGASVSDGTWAANYGSDVDTPMGIFGFSSRGPREDGGFKPNLVAPGAAVSTTPTWLPGSPVTGVGYELPPGYSMFNGTSMASPQAAGAAALLLSAAKATGVDAKPASLRASLYDSARFLSGVDAHEQGNGLLDVEDAWQALAKGGLATSAYTIDAQVCTPISAYLTTPHRGTGLYHRCPGAIPTLQQVLVTRTSGPAGANLHRISWTGNDGTFRAMHDTVQLPLNQAVAVPVWVRPKGNGAHSAIMELDDPSTRGTDARMMATVAVADELAAPSFARTHSGRVDKAQTESYLVTVPENARTLQVKLDGVDAGDRVRFVAQHPYGVAVEDGCYTNMDTEGCNPNVRNFKDPMPGVWEITIEASRTSPTRRSDYRLTVNVFGAAAKAEAKLGTLEMHSPSPVSWEVTNHLGAVQLAASTSPLSSRRTERPTIGDQQQKMYELLVPFGTGRFTARIGNPSDPAADLDLIVVSNGVVLGQSADGDSEEKVEIDNPPPGFYAIWIDGYSVPAGSTEIDYVDELSSVTNGTVATTFAAPLALARGETKTVTADVTATGTAPAGRKLHGDLDLVNTDGAVVGAAGLTIEAVHGPTVHVDEEFGPLAAFTAIDGVVAGSAQIDEVSRPVRWTKDGGIKPYPGLGHIFGLNNHGDGAGMAEHVGAPTLPGAFRADGTKTELPLPAWRPDALWGVGYGINDAGTVVGSVTAVTENADWYWHFEGFRWTEQGGMVKLPHLSANPELTEPYAINAGGTVVGVSMDADGWQTAVRWDADGNVHRIGPAAEGEHSFLVEINDAGTAVGESGNRAAIWTAEGGMRRLPDFGLHSKAVGINSSGWIIGEADVAPYEPHVVAWDPQGRMWDLSNMIGNDRWWLSEAADVTDDGGFVVYGIALDGSGKTHAILRF